MLVINHLITTLFNIPNIQVSDQFRHGDGSLLPLWHFRADRTKRKQVTALCWNPCYPDLFAVGYGSYDFLRQGSGMVCCFSLKNTSHPEFVFSTESGVTCLDFHPHHQSLLAVGCYEGTVMVFDIRNKKNLPIYSSSIRTGKHTDPVWQVHWQVRTHVLHEVLINLNISILLLILPYQKSKNLTLKKTFHLFFDIIAGRCFEGIKLFLNFI
jgi:hypothetical protein